MSSEQLRQAALRGDLKGLKNLLAGGANPCSHDEFGLGALHYAAWNGHLECAAALAINDTFRSQDGELMSCLSLLSVAGFTALHMAAAEGEEGGKICAVLANSGADLTVLDHMGRTPFEVAEEEKRYECSAALREPPTPEQVVAYRNALREKHGVVVRRKGAKEAASSGDEGDGPAPLSMKAQLVQLKALLEGNVLDAEEFAAEKNIVLNGGRSQHVREASPRHVKKKTERKRYPVKPKELDIEEHRILGYAKTNFRAGDHTPVPIQNLDKATVQADINERRRHRLATSSDLDLGPGIENPFACPAVELEGTYPENIFIRKPARPGAAGGGGGGG